MSKEKESSRFRELPAL